MNRVLQNSVFSRRGFRVTVLRGNVRRQLQFQLSRRTLCQPVTPPSQEIQPPKKKGSLLKKLFFGTLSVVCFGLVVLYFVGDKMADEADKLNNQLVMEMNELLERPLTKEEEFVVLVTKGRRLQELGYYEDAIVPLDQAIGLIDAKSDPEYVWQLYFWYARALSGLGKNNEALRILDMMLIDRTLPIGTGMEWIVKTKKESILEELKNPNSVHYAEDWNRHNARLRWDPKKERHGPEQGHQITERNPQRA